MNKQDWMRTITTILKLRNVITEDESRKIMREVEKVK